MGAARTLNISDEERERRSALARDLHQRVVDPETGRRAFGGPQPGSGRPRKPRAAEIVAEEARKEARTIVAAFKDALDPSQRIETRLKAAESWLKVEHNEATLQHAEDKDLGSLSDEELIMRVSAGIVRVMQTKALDAEISAEIGMPVIEGRVVEVDESYPD